MKQEWKEQLPIDDVKQIKPVSGGDVNQAYKVTTSQETYFLLVQPHRSEEFYAAEIVGLEKFEEAGITAPRVISSGQINSDAYLLLSYLEEGGRGDQRELAKLVAKMHSHHQPDGKFGFELPHEGGDHSFDNDWCDTWSELFINQRMDVLCDNLIANGEWTEADRDTYQAVRDVMVQALASHTSKPSLLHGDMWGGNHMFLTDGQPALFDPSPLYGDREFDIGITKAFGAFSNDFYEAYHQSYPLSKGAELRIEFYKLYILMVHLLKFGGMYRGSVDRSMNKILNY
ncbi:fructosamine kinase family protein [Staphylococcus sp. SQ8-PEA]|uniref:Fructosamine kinase family protein n=1 Tax=Staphylococcus marylandisciuri TaxID=2981529 RepID=A0ABT2QN40_9STAP|nr:fructosamine kinase family protein [Staphylococcus marylandisciuri]MCU5745390.1 fructosamine kinase family protein [Staphylococcus marylandisciuri]